MAKKTSNGKPQREAAIFARIWESGPSGWTPELARHVLRLKFADEDVARMHALAAKNQEGALDAAESDELDSYIKVGDLLALLQSRARRYLQKAPVPSHG